MVSTQTKSREHSIQSTNPVTGEVLGEAPITDADGVADVVARAREAQARWALLDVRERAVRLLRVRDSIVRRADELIELLVQECGKTKQEALVMEVLVVADLATYFCKRAKKILAPERIPLHLYKTKKSYLHYVPRGVIGIISPWNFPLSIPMGEVIMGLLAGNAVVLKPSEVTPLIALKAKEIFVDAGFDSELFQVINGYGETGAALVAADVNKIIFTGSVATGKKVAAACGERLIPCTLELGGKAPAVVCADADLERTANALTWGAFGNSGQVCCSVERVYAHTAVYDELLAKIQTRVEKLRQGDPSSGDVDVGSMTWDKQLRIVEDRVDNATSAGAKILVGGAKGDGMFFPPTVLIDVQQDMDVMQKETFGPVLPIMRVESEEQAMELANDSHLGLLGYVFTRDRKKGRRLAEMLQCGTVMVNDVLATFGAPETPWSGVKQSGIGFTHSAAGLRALCEQRHVNVDRIAPRRELWWYPYTDKGYRLLLGTMRFLFGKRR